MSDRKPLTDAQTRVLAALCCYVTMNGHQPSTDELAKILGNNPSGVHHHLRGIALAGWIELTGLPRSIIIPPDVMEMFKNTDSEERKPLVSRRLPDDVA